MQTQLHVLIIKDQDFCVQRFQNDEYCVRSCFQSAHVLDLKIVS